MLEDFFYTLRDDTTHQHKRNHSSRPDVYQIRFHQKTVAEFKTTIFQQHYSNKALVLQIQPKDLEVIYRSTVLENDFDMEYCIDTIQTPLQVYVPVDISYDVYKEYAANCLALVKDIGKKCGRSYSERHDMELQNEMA